jgi:hypothetical protein
MHEKLPVWEFEVQMALFKHGFALHGSLSDENSKVDNAWNV